MSEDDGSTNAMMGGEYESVQMSQGLCLVTLAERDVRLGDERGLAHRRSAEGRGAVGVDGRRSWSEDWENELDRVSAAAASFFASPSRRVVRAGQSRPMN